MSMGRHVRRAHTTLPMYAMFMKLIYTSVRHILIYDVKVKCFDMERFTIILFVVVH
jgi:hypothetical protein